jgi:hypothetical protein
MDDDRNEERAGQEPDLQSPDLVEHELAAGHRRRKQELELGTRERECGIRAAHQPPFRDQQCEPAGGERGDGRQAARAARSRDDGRDTHDIARRAIEQEDEIRDRDRDGDQVARRPQTTGLRGQPVAEGP